MPSRNNNTSGKLEPAAVAACTVMPDWLAVSTDGFAAMNAGRDPAHLVKELVQNALDALGPGGGQIFLTAEPSHQSGKLDISCLDEIGRAHV